ncbi:MAG TPA: STAS domain-containing protein [Planctomycetota bacterium]|nr:STAS domain-containing protein [Planctomycetota bacterium]
MPAPAFVLEGSRLTVRINLDPGREDELRRCCDQLLARAERDSIIDLSAVSYIHSLSVGILSYAWVEALSRNKEIRFVVSQHVSDVFQRTGLSRVFTCLPPEPGGRG